MLKKILLLTSIASISACSSFSQCQSDKNYVISNPEAIEEYKKLDSENKIKSIYYQIEPLEKCNYDSCVRFNTKKFDFVEMQFNDEYRKGVYRIYATKDLSRKDCFEHNTGATSLKDICFYSLKNEGGVIYSDYVKKNFKINGVYTASFYNKSRNEILYEVVSQTYSSKAFIGTSSAGFCKASKKNNPDYKFNISDLGN
jgi:hypothetical protein